MIHIKNSDFLSLSELTEEVSAHSLSYNVLLSNLPGKKSPSKQVIEVTRNSENKMCMNVVPPRYTISVSPLFQTIEFEDHECEAMSYFLEKWDYGLCHLYVRNKTSVIEVHYPLSSN